MASPALVHFAPHGCAPRGVALALACVVFAGLASRVVAAPVGAITASAASAPPAAGARGDTTPAGLQGTWQVLHVAVNRALAAGAAAHRDPDDARLLGGVRVFDLEGAVDPAPDGCRHLSWSAGGSAPLSSLLARDAKVAGREAPSPESYGLHVGDPTVQSYTAACAAPGDGIAATPYEDGRWFALLSSDRLLLGEGPGAVAVLERVTAETPMHASIDCTQAVGDAQKTICTSRQLAGLDLAVASAYRHALLAAHRRGTAAADALRESQDAWRAKREACGSDARCLGQSMQGRVDSLLSD